MGLQGVKLSESEHAWVVGVTLLLSVFVVGAITIMSIRLVDSYLDTASVHTHPDHTHPHDHPDHTHPHEHAPHEHLHEHPHAPLEHYHPHEHVTTLQVEE